MTNFPFTCRLLFIISRNKLVVSRNFFIHKNGLKLSLSAHFNSKILNFNLTFAVCRIPVKLKLSIVDKRRNASYLPNSPYVIVVQRVENILSDIYTF